jgi:hypothetical protein
MSCGGGYKMIQEKINVKGKTRQFTNNKKHTEPDLPFFSAAMDNSVFMSLYKD